MCACVYTYVFSIFIFICMCIHVFVFLWVYMYVWVPVCDGELIPQLLSTLSFEPELLLVCGSPMSLGLPNQTGWKNPGTCLSLPPGTHSRPEITKYLFVIQAVLHAFWGSNLNPHVSAVSISLPELSLQPWVSLSTSWLHRVKKVIDLGRGS